MAKLYFKYGAMGSSKSAQALITQFNYEELGMTVWLIKPSVDDRDGANIIRSRIGLQREAQVIHPDEDIIATFARAGHADVIIADEAQFFSPEQIDQLRRIVDEQNIPVLCFGLRTDFLTHFFPGARRLMELADSITEIKTVCACGRKATVNARIDGTGRVITEGGQILLGGNDSYVAMCRKCWWIRSVRRGSGKSMNRRASRILTVCAGAWLLVIWGQSCMPAAHSGAAAHC
ncbi:MAG: thymidine kinase [Oscillospiraceae bacterium]